MGRKKKPQDPDALLESLLAEADPAILARFTGQSKVESADVALDRLGAGETVTVETSLDVGELDILDISEASAEPTPAPPVSKDELEEPAPDEDEGDGLADEAPESRTIRADGLPVAVVDLWGDLDESSPPVSAPPSVDLDPEED